MRVYAHPSSNPISVRPPLYIDTKKPCVRVVSGKALPTIDIGREDGKTGQEHAWLLHLREAWETGRRRCIAAAEDGGWRRGSFSLKWFTGKEVGERNAHGCHRIQLPPNVHVK